jgi:dipeptidyl aminopeptidase/acylaminoacyl peptidase
MRSRRKHLLLELCGIALLLFPIGNVARSETSANGRAMTPEDLLTKQTIRETALSPDGRWAAIVVERPRKVGESYVRGYLRGLERSDVWLASTDGRKLINVTRGEQIHAGYWSPVWSPDSKLLAMASTRGGDNVRAFIYDLHTQRLRACRDDGLDLALRIETFENKASSMVWFDPTHLLLGVLPPGIRPLALDETERTPHIAAKAIADVKRGRAVTASILDTEGADRSAVQRKNVALTLVDVVTNKARVLTSVPLIETRLSQRIVSISPGRTYAAILATDYPVAVSQGSRLGSDNLHPLRLGVANLETRGQPAWVQNVRPVSFGLAATPTPIRWAPSGSTFALIGTSVNDAQVLPGAFTVAVNGKKPEATAALKHDAKAGTQFVTAEDIQWSSNNELLVYGYAGAVTDLLAEASRKDVRGDARDNTKDTARRDWWLISLLSSCHNLTREMAQPPRMLLRTRNSNAMLAGSGGKLWTIDVPSRTTKALDLGATAAASIVWPRANDASRPADYLILSYPKLNGSELLRINMSAGEPASVSIGTIPRGAVFAGYSSHGEVITYETEVTELRAIAAKQRQPVTLISLNRQLDAIAKPQYRIVQYQTADGKKLSGALLLPHGYTTGQRYPLIIHVYGGTLAPAGDWASPYGSLSSVYFNPLVFAGRGYAVLVPSIPLEPMGTASDPLLEMDKGVKPAIDKVVEMGIADPDRLGLIGFSYGGYSVYGLVTQTGRFKAAVAASGVTDLLGLYGTIDPRYRFGDVPNPMWGPYGVEAHQMRMGMSPWKDRERYLRNSPYLQADKVSTPLLMIHGDLDSLPLSQAEQFFVALNRLGKRAKLIRYLGEAHSIDSPGNTLDMWEHIFTWFDEFLLHRQSNQSAKTK